MYHIFCIQSSVDDHLGCFELKLHDTTWYHSSWGPICSCGADRVPAESLMCWVFCWVFSFFSLDICFVYISNVNPFPHYPLSHANSSCSPPASISWLASPYSGGIDPSWQQWLLLSLMSEMVIVCYICGWSHGSLHVHSLVGGLVPGSSGGTGWYILLFLLWGCKPLQLLGSFL